MPRRKYADLRPGCPATVAFAECCRGFYDTGASGVCPLVGGSW